MNQDQASNPVCPEDLLAESTWIRSLARSLIRDESTALDVAQDAYVIALERGPGVVRDRSGLRSWLGAVVRRLAKHETRGAVRRARRQAVAAQSHPEETDSDVVERSALQQKVVEAVTQLPEPYRTTLLLHYMEGLPVVRIAERSDSKEPAVRKRLSRGREMLREKLRAEWGDEYRTRLAALIESSAKRAPLWPAGLAAAVVLLGVFSWFAQRDDQAEADTLYAYSPDPEFGESGSPSLAGFGVSFWNDDYEPTEQEKALSEELGLELRELKPLETELTGEEVRALAEREAIAASLLENAEFFTAQTKHPRSGKDVTAKIGRIPLPRVSKEARIVFAVESGRPIGIGLWGTPELDDDPDWRWSMYAQEMIVMGSKVVIGKDSMSQPEFNEFLVKLSSDEETGMFARAFMTQRVAMLANMLYVQGLKANERAQRRPRSDSFKALERHMLDLAAVSGALGRVLGDQTEAHEDRARDTAKLYQSLSAAPKADIETLGKELSESCKACHDALVSDESTTWFEAFDPHAAELKLPRGMLRIGYDLAPALGDDGTLSQRLASALRIGLIYLDAAQ